MHDPRRIRVIFDLVAEAPATQRAAILDAECGADAALRREVLSLLEAGDGEHALLDAPGAGLLGELLDGSGLLVGRRIGAYRLERLVASGGMGSVYLAKRVDEQFEHIAAIKLIRHGLIDEGSLRRFRSERQTLARLEHPYIARLLDGGVTEAALPYLVMEYVEGQPIHRYCDERRLPVAERLELFLRVCDAVQYAHRNLVVHRDIKPENILITADGNPKLVDFGIAKTIEPDTAEAPPTATGGHRMFTPEYASPEQIRGQAITTATDVYSLGVVLFELLAGHRPFRLHTRALHEVERAVCESEPDRPSTAVQRTVRRTTTGGELEITPAQVGAARRTEPARLRRLLRGDLDAIVLRALQKEPRQRYASVEQLAADIRNQMDGLPIVARPISRTARTWKLLQRHRFAFGMAAIVLIALVAALTTVAVARMRERMAAIRAREEAENARVEVVKSTKVIDFLQNTLTAVSPEELGQDVRMSEVLGHALTTLRLEPEDDPEVETAIRTAIGKAYAALGRFDDAEPQLRAALALQERIHGGDHPDVSRSLANLAQLLYQQRSFAAAEDVAQRALEMSRRLYGENHPDIGRDLNNLAAVRRAQGALDEAEQLYRAALALRRALPPGAELQVAETLNNLGNVARARGDLAEAEQLCREALALRRAALAPDHPLVTQSLDNLAVLLASRRAYAEAAELLTESLALARRRLGAEHPHLANALNTLAGIRFLQGDPAAAEPLLRECLALRRQHYPADDAKTLYVETVLGRCLGALGRFDEGEQLLQRTLVAAQDAGQIELARRAALGLSELYERQGRAEEAAAYRARAAPAAAPASQPAGS